jgi:hypothetical protein
MQQLLSGPEIRDVRMRASRSTFPSLKRIRMYHRKEKVPAHVGKKQKAKRFSRFVEENP